MSQPSSDEEVYARKYRAMKKKLRLLVYEREAFIEELKKSQRKLLKVSRDKSFLLDRLLRYEEPRDSSTSSDSDSTESSDGAESSASMLRDRKRKAVHHSPSAAAIASAAAGGKATAAAFEPAPAAKRKSPAAAVKNKSAKLQQSASGNQWNNKMAPPGGGEQSLVCDSLTRQEVERQLELKRIVRPQFMNIDATPSSLPPDDIFSHDNSNSAVEVGESGGFVVKVKEEDDDANLVIDMAN